MKRTLVLGAILCGLLATREARASGEPQPFPNASPGWVCSAPLCLQMTNNFSTNGAEVLRLTSAQGISLKASTLGTAANAINAQNLSTSSTVSSVYAGNSGAGPAFTGRATRGPAADFASEVGDSVISTAAQHKSAFSGSAPGQDSNVYYGNAHGPGSNVLYADGNVVIVNGTLTVNGVVVTELLREANTRMAALEATRSREASVLGNGWGVAALCAVGVVVAMRRRRQA